MRLGELTKILRRFAKDRNWEQLHVPKNLAIALMVEAAEVAEHYTWGDDADLEAVRYELADVLIYLVRLADVLGIDLIEATLDKIEWNGQRYPATDWAAEVL